MTVATMPREPAVGDRVAGGLKIERILSRGEDGDAFVVRIDAETHAVCFVIPAEHPDPSLDPEAARLWGTERRVVRDDSIGRLVVDELVAGEFLADRLATGRALSSAAVEDLERRVRAAHEAGSPHGRLRPAFIVESRDGLACAGWGTAPGEPEDLVALDLADLKGMTGSSGGHEKRELVRDKDHRSAPPSAMESGPSLHAAVVSEHLPTLRRALAAAELRSHEIDEGELTRARDALQRLEKKVEDALRSAEHRLETGDPLGAVASCREAIRHGAEPESEALLRRARRQAKSLVVGRGHGRLAWGGIGLVALAAALVVAGIVHFTRGTDGEGGLADSIAELERGLGTRAALIRLVALRSEGGETKPELQGMLEASVSKLLDQERTRLLELRRVTIAQGGQPAEGDAASEAALAELEEAVSELSHPALDTRLQRSLSSVDRAASLYRARTDLSADQAERAAMDMLAEDPSFLAPVGGER